MSEPTVTHAREHGGTLDHQAIKIRVERTAILDDDLRAVVDRSRTLITLTTRDGSVSSHRYGLSVKAAVNLRNALNSALADVHDLPPYDADRAGVVDGGGEVCHCGRPVVYGYDGDPTHHRGMCGHCDSVRCDAYPGECIFPTADETGAAGDAS